MLSKLINKVRDYFADELAETKSSEYFKMMMLDLVSNMAEKQFKLFRETSESFGFEKIYPDRQYSIIADYYWGQDVLVVNLHENDITIAVLLRNYYKNDMTSLDKYFNTLDDAYNMIKAV